MKYTHDSDKTFNNPKLILCDSEDSDTVYERYIKTRAK